MFAGKLRAYAHPRHLARCLGGPYGIDADSLLVLENFSCKSISPGQYETDATNECEKQQTSRTGFGRAGLRPAAESRALPHGQNVQACGDRFLRRFGLLAIVASKGARNLSYSPKRCSTRSRSDSKRAGR